MFHLSNLKPRARGGGGEGKHRPVNTKAICIGKIEGEMSL